MKITKWYNLLPVYIYIMLKTNSANACEDKYTSCNLFPNLCNTQIMINNCKKTCKIGCTCRDNFSYCLQWRSNCDTNEWMKRIACKKTCGSCDCRKEWISNFNTNLTYVNSDVIINSNLTNSDLSIDGIHLNEMGGQKLANIINSIFSNGNDLVILGDSHSSDVYSKWLHKTINRESLNKSVSGFSIIDQLNNINDLNFPNNTKKVICFLGTNNLLLGNNISNSIQDYKSLTSKIRNLTNNTIIYLITIPPVSSYIDSLCNL